MKHNLLQVCLMLILVHGILESRSQVIRQSVLKSGAAKVDITPDPSSLPNGYTGIHDRLYTRSIVIEQNGTRAAFINIDIGVISDNFWQKVSSRIEKEFKIPAANILMSATHSHSSPFLVGGLGQNDPKTIGFTTKVENAIVDATRQAISKFQPARIGFGTGTSYLNVNRDAIDPVTRRWTQGSNYEGASDKTVAVVKIESLEGEPIAVFVNYAVHANVMFMSGVISADSPGETSRYIEEFYNNKIVALWTSGAAGDQNPRYLQPMADVNKIKIDAAISSGKANELNEAIMYIFKGGEVPVKVDQSLLNRQAQIITSMGQILGEEVLTIMKSIKGVSPDAKIIALQDTVTCPGRTRTNTGREGAPGTYVDGDPVNIRIGVLRIGNIIFATVNGEVYSPIGQRLKKESPYSNTMMVTITNGMVTCGYIPSDDAFVRYTFQVLGSKLKSGCAEDAIVSGLLNLISKTDQ